MSVSPQALEYEQMIRADERRRILAAFRALLKLSPHMEPQFHGQYNTYTCPPTIPMVISRMEELLEQARLEIWRDPLFCWILRKKIEKHRRNFELFQKWEVMVEDVLKGPPPPTATEEEVEQWLRQHRQLLG